MFEGESKIPKFPDNSRVGITLCLNEGEDDKPFEATVFFGKPGKTAEEMIDEKAITLSASGKLRLDIGKNSHIELFVENSNRLSESIPDETTDFKGEGV